jgi:hypothetical protein
VVEARVFTQQRSEFSTVTDRQVANDLQALMLKFKYSDSGVSAQPVAQQRKQPRTGHTVALSSRSIPKIAESALHER